ncbi:Panacea domain-containing protein [Paenibacillus odorifer]|uniref:Panacea domain-containing protein n=1 Tax=Paenibacillus odorifer TaxID=189426 RepID=UPI00096E241D|nr:type II toxin-antitoxin system antitoxin SocA domain-containing protein [Paenibacillus odorifer]OME19950.1 hypothetical protein BSK57_23565 [Paenibacillus odorifer]
MGVRSKHSVFKVASYLLSKSDPYSDDFSVTHLKLQKLVYYAQAWHYAIKQKPLFKEEIEAWVHGPVCPDLYHAYKNNGFEIIKPKMDNEDFDFNSFEIEVMDLVWEAYGGMSGGMLEQLTHTEDPWIEARGNLDEKISSNNIISLSSMGEYYNKPEV